MVRLRKTKKNSFCSEFKIEKRNKIQLFWAAIRPILTALLFLIKTLIFFFHKILRWKIISGPHFLKEALHLSECQNRYQKIQIQVCRHLEGPRNSPCLKKLNSPEKNCLNYDLGVLKHIISKHILKKSRMLIFINILFATKGTRATCNL